MDSKTVGEVVEPAKINGYVETGVEGEGADEAAKNGETKEELSSKLKGLGSLSNKDMLVRADMIDFKEWDVQFEKQLTRNRSWSTAWREGRVKEEWEIDLAKLDIKTVIAHGTYGTIYKGVYDGLDVAGNFNNFSLEVVNPILILSPWHDLS